MNEPLEFMQRRHVFGFLKLVEHSLLCNSGLGPPISKNRTPDPGQLTGQLLSSENANFHRVRELGKVGCKSFVEVAGSRVGCHNPAPFIPSVL